jgi:hypothetical protein
MINFEKNKLFNIENINVSKKSKGRFYAEEETILLIMSKFDY